MRRTTGAWIVVLALVASACGARVSEQQAVDEAREDALRAGVFGGPGGLGGGTGLGGLELEDGLSGAGAGGFQGAGASGAGAAGTGQGAEGSGAGAGATGPLRATDVGITPEEIHVGTVVSLTGPVPGLFRGALIGAQAYAAYQNAQGGVHGRRLRVIPADDSLDSGRNRAVHLQLRDRVFAFVGSFSTADDGGVGVLRECNCPDLGVALAVSRFNLPVHYSPQPIPPGWRGGPPALFAQQYDPAVIQNWALLYSGVEAAREIARAQRAVYESHGFNVVYEREVAPNTTNFTGDVVEMQRRGVRSLSYQGDAGNMGRLAAAMHQQGFTVDLPNWGNDAYSDEFLQLAGDGAEGAIIDQVYAMFLGEDEQRIPEVRTFREWMRRVDPNQTVNLFALFGWLSMRLFVEAMDTVGPEPTRAKLLDALSRIGTWDGGGLVAPVNIGQKSPSDCFFLFARRQGQFVRTFPGGEGAYACDVAPYQRI